MNRRDNEMARPAGFEPAATGLEGRCSIQLSYGRIQARGRMENFEKNEEKNNYMFFPRIRCLLFQLYFKNYLVGARGFEPPTSCSQR